MGWGGTKNRAPWSCLKTNFLWLSSDCSADDRRQISRQTTLHHPMKIGLEDFNTALGRANAAALLPQERNQTMYLSFLRSILHDFGPLLNRRLACEVATLHLGTCQRSLEVRLGEHREVAEVFMLPQQLVQFLRCKIESTGTAVNKAKGQHIIARIYCV
jgi:hypothetical protein